MEGFPLKDIPQQWGAVPWMMGVMLVLLVVVVVGALGGFAYMQRILHRLLERADLQAEKNAERHEKAMAQQGEVFRESIETVVEPIKTICAKWDVHSAKIDLIHDHITRGSK